MTELEELKKRVAELEKAAKSPTTPTLNSPANRLYRQRLDAPQRNRSNGGSDPRECYPGHRCR
jgi:hypothetical protein